MWKNKKVVIIALLAALVLIASIGGVALARSGPANNAQPKVMPEVTGNVTQPLTLWARVAKIMGIDQAKLEAAVKQAQWDMQLEALKNRLQAMVGAGKITQAQADEYLKWWQSRPDLTTYEQQFRQWQQARPNVPQEFKNWQQGKPDLPLPAGPGGRGFRRMPGRMMGGGGGLPLSGGPTY